MMMKCRYEILILLALVLCVVQAESSTLQCRPYSITEPEFTGPEGFSKGLLWQVGRGGNELGYIFGTIHVDDSNILDLPPPVMEALERSEHFAMEVIPSAQDAMDFSMTMFFMDGQRLDQLIPAEMYGTLASVLGQYDISEEMLMVMQPWAAYIIMSYPAEMDTVLDLHLLNIARKNDLQVSGLETSRQQINIFSQMPLDDQLRILADAICHYDTLLSDFDTLKALYLERDLAGMYIQAQKYTFGDDSVYESVSEHLISRRNRRMAENINTLLQHAKSFVAVGAMHLPGDDGILSLLQEYGYTVTRIY